MHERTHFADDYGSEDGILMRYPIGYTQFTLYRIIRMSVGKNEANTLRHADIRRFRALRSQLLSLAVDLVRRLFDE